MKILILVFLTLGLAAFFISSCSTFGSLPQGEELDRVASSPNYDKDRKQFVNRQQDVLDEMRKKAFSWKVFKEWFGGNEAERVPKNKLPEEKPDLQAFLEDSEELKVIWFGHSSFLLNMEGKIILVDPVFSQAASPFSFLVKRFQPPILKLEELPEIDYILISHDHYDHLDMETVQFFVDKKTEFITPLGVGEHIKSWGVDKSRVSEMDWWQETQRDQIKIIATPSQHFSGRGLVNQNHTLWASWVIQSSKHNVYFSGDTGYDVHFKDIGEKFGPFDIAFIENGQYNPQWEEVHMLPEQAAQAYFDLKAKKFFPIHWGMFELSLHSWYEPIVKISQLGEERDINIVAPKIGEMISVTDDLETSNWWQNLMPKQLAEQEAGEPEPAL